MKYLVLGATGMAGHTISIYLEENGHTVYGLSQIPFNFLSNTILCDVTEKDDFISILKNGDFDIVINCIGILNQAAELNKATAIYLNSYLPHLITDVLKKKRTKLIHMSTDCVFSGDKGKYSEDSFPDGRTYYDRTKALGEINDDKNLTFRNSIIGPDINANGIGLLHWFMRQSGTIKGYVKAVWTGVTTLTLAKAMESAAREGLTGIYNLVNNQTISKYELLLLFNKHLKDNALTILPDTKIEINKSLISNRTDFSYQVPSYEQMIIEMKEWINNHQEIYPEYYRF